MSSSLDPFDLDQLRLPDKMIGDLIPKRRPPHHRPGDPFIKGPIPYAWIASACRLPGAGLQVAMSYRFHADRFRLRYGRRWDLPDVAKGLRISLNSARRGLRAAELAGLLSVSREPGCKLAVSVRDIPDPEAGPERRPLYGPIPWAWWLPASRLPGRSLQVAAVCWLLAGWERSADFELAPDDWAEFGLSRFSAARGLEALERAGLVSVARRPGLSPIVSILAVTSSGAAGIPGSWPARPLDDPAGPPIRPVARLWDLRPMDRTTRPGDAPVRLPGRPSGLHPHRSKIQESQISRLDDPPSACL
jgi:hypothetical protein